MSSPNLVIDTDILSLLMRKNSSVLAKAKEYLAEHEQFTISIITRYEIQVEIFTRRRRKV